MRLIDADALMKTLGITDMDCGKCKWGDHGYCTRGSSFTDACTAIEDAPSVEERKKGEWKLRTYMPHHNYCTCCDADSPYNKRWKYCPNCGADMRGNNDA